jgi:hypothetical protein
MKLLIVVSVYQEDQERERIKADKSFKDSIV